MYRRFALFTAIILSLVPISACTPKSNNKTTAPVEIKAGVSVSREPLDPAELIRLRDQELVPLVEKGKISANEAREYMRAQKKRLNMPNHNETRQLDKILNEKGLQ
jgi:hypothetical protein